MKALNLYDKTIVIIKLEHKVKKIKRTIRQIEKKNRKAYDDNLIIRSDHQRLYAQKKELCGELAATLLTQTHVLRKL